MTPVKDLSHTKVTVLMTTAAYVMSRDFSIHWKVCPSIDAASDEQSDAATTAFKLWIGEHRQRELAWILAEVTAWTLSSSRFDLLSISR